MFHRIFWSLWQIWAGVLVFVIASLPPALPAEVTGPWDKYPTNNAWYTTRIPELAGKYFPSDVTPEALAERAKMYPWETAETRDLALALKKSFHDADLTRRLQHAGMIRRRELWGLVFLPIGVLLLGRYWLFGMGGMLGRRKRRV